MSLLLCVQQYDKLIFATDTAISIILGATGEVQRRKEEAFDKINFITKYDAVFISGLYPMTEIAQELCKNSVEGDYINTEKLQQELRARYPRDKKVKAFLGEDKKEAFEVSITILRYKENKTYVCELNQKSDYKIVDFVPKMGKLTFLSTGIRSEHCHEIAQKYINQCPLDLTFALIYKEVAYEGIGSQMIVYQLDKNGHRKILQQKIVESGIKYYEGNDPLYYTAHINASSINGSTLNGNVINGTEINSSTMNSSVINASEINATDINGSTIKGSTLETTGNFGGSPKTTKIQDGVILSDYIVVGAETGEHTTIDDNFVDTNTMTCNSLIAHDGVQSQGDIWLGGQTHYLKADSNIKLIGFSSNGNVVVGTDGAYYGVNVYGGNFNFNGDRVLTYSDYSSLISAISSLSSQVSSLQSRVAELESK